MMPRQNFATAVYLAYGITTTSDPATTSVEAFPMAEMIEAGETVGPRVFSTAEALYVGDAGLITASPRTAPSLGRCHDQAVHAAYPTAATVGGGCGS